MMTRFADFDAALATAPEPLRCKLFGCEWELHPDLPAAIAVKVVRWEAAGPEYVISDTEALEVIERLVPAQVLAAWYDRGLGMGQLTQLMPMLLGLYFAASADDEQQGGENPKAPSASASAGA